MLLGNAGLPMIFVELPVLVVALVPVVGLEAALLRRSLAIPWRQAIRDVFGANLLSTFVGVPLAWAAQVAGQLALGGGVAWDLSTPLDRLAAVIVQSGWLIPYENELHWMVPAAALWLLLPCLLVSIAVEQWWLRRCWSGLPVRRILRAVVLANCVSYLLPATWWAVLWVSAWTGR